MTILRVGTRGSDLAVTQTRWVCDELRRAHSELEIEEIIIKTHGDVAQDQPFGAAWPVGSFVTAIEQALLDERVDFAVHSYKDLPSASPEPLIIAATPPREAVEDVLVVRTLVDLDRVPSGFRIGTSSPRRTCQLRALGDVEIVPIRGNVPSRIAKLETENLDAVVLAAAGMNRLGLRPEHVVVLPAERFIPSPAQGALAIQARAGDRAAEVVAVLDDVDTRRAVRAERAFLGRVSAGCETPIAAWGTISGDEVELRAHLFSDDGSQLAEGRERGVDPEDIGTRLADRLKAELREQA